MRGSWREKRRDRGAKAPTELHADPAVRSYEQGPFPAVVLPDFPPLLVELVQRVTGRPFDAGVFAAYERIRAFTGYRGVNLVPRLEQAQWRTEVDPPADRPLAAPATGRAPAKAAKAPADRKKVRGIDPRDLGD